jgi:hypothetical protein
MSIGGGPKKSLEKKNRLIIEFRKVTGSKVNLQNKLIFLGSICV